MSVKNLVTHHTNGGSDEYAPIIMDWNKSKLLMNNYHCYVISCVMIPIHCYQQLHGAIMIFIWSELDPETIANLGQAYNLYMCMYAEIKPATPDTIGINRLSIAWLDNFRVCGNNLNEIKSDYDNRWLPKELKNTWHMKIEKEFQN